MSYDAQRYKKMIKVKHKFAHIMKNAEFCRLIINKKVNFKLMKIKKLTIFSLVLAFLIMPMDALADRKRSKNNNKREIRNEEFNANPVPAPAVVQEYEQPEPDVREAPVRINDISKQMSGEWNVVEVNGERVSLPRGMRAFLCFDFKSEMIYGNTGVNDLNASFEIKRDNRIEVENLIMTKKTANVYAAQNVERELLGVLRESPAISLSHKQDIVYMELKGKGRHVVRLRRQNLDFMNGEWIVKSVYGKYLDIPSKIRLVNDVNAKTVNIFSEGNVINGVIYIDPTVEYGIEYENLISTHNQWRYVDKETRLLIALEEVLYCRRVNDREVELYTKVIDKSGRRYRDNVVVVLERDRRY